MVFEAKYKLNDRQYLAVLDKAVVIVTTDQNGKAIKWAIFTKEVEN